MIDQAEKLRELAHHKVIHHVVDNTIVSAPRKKNSFCQTIAITSGKGGVGKSNTTLSLAASISKLGKKVLLFDGDLGLANLHILLGVSPRYTLSDVLQNKCTLDEALHEISDGLMLLPGASGVMSLADPESLKFEKLLRFLENIEKEYDYLLIDGGAGISRVAIQLNLLAQHVFLVITPDPTSLADAYSTAKILFSKGIHRIYVIVNMADSDKHGMTVFNKLNELMQKFVSREITLAGILPFNKNVKKMIRLQKNLYLEDDTCQFSYKIHSIAEKLCGVKSWPEKGFFSRFFSSEDKEEE